MGIWDRLGEVIKSYINDGDGRPLGRGGSGQSGDPDLKAAFEELDDFLSGESGRGRTAGNGEGPRAGPGSRRPSGGDRTSIPPELRTAFAELSLEPGASEEECKAAYKKLLKIHHPDRHAGHPGNMKKATEKSARINAAYDRIERWRRGESS